MLTTVWLAQEMVVERAWWWQSGWLAFALSVLILLSTVIVILIRHKLGAPTHFVTNLELSRLEDRFSTLEDKFDDVTNEVKAWEKEFRAACASNVDVNQLGAKVERSEKFMLTVQDMASQALTKSDGALRDVTNIQENFRRLETTLHDLNKLPGLVGNLSGQMDVLLRNLGEKP